MLSFFANLSRVMLIKVMLINKKHVVFFDPRIDYSKVPKYKGDAY